MDTPADLDPNCPYCSAGLELGSHVDHVEALSAHPDSYVDPPDLGIGAHRQEQLEQIASEQSNQIRSYLSLPAFKSLHSSLPGPAQSASSSVQHNAPDMIDPQFSVLFSSGELFEDWCARTRRLMQLQEEEDQHRQVDALSYDLANDPELTVPIGDLSPEDNEHEHVFSQRPSKRVRITTPRAKVACDLCRKSRDKVALFIMPEYRF